jgi:hypothetical protein
MKRRHSLRPWVDGLEDWALLSATGKGLALAPIILVPPTVHPHHIALNGEVSGTWTIQMLNPDVGQQQTLTGSGPVQPLGNVGATGTLHATGFIARGSASGMLTLSNAQGSVTIKLMGPRQPGFSLLPRTFSFQIVAATGKYRGATDRGTAMLTEVEAAGTPLPMPVTAGLPIIVGPIFGLTLKSA